MKFIYRLIKHLVILLAISLPLMVLGWLVVPIVLLFIGNNPKFPRFLNWFDNADHWVGRNTESYDEVITQGFWYRYYYISFRNPTNYFGYKVLGFKVSNNPTILEVIGDQRMGDGTFPGFYYTEIKSNNKVYYEYYYVYKWNSTKCLRFRLGYKIGDANRVKNQQIEQVLVLQPYKTYTGT